MRNVLVIAGNSLLLALRDPKSLVFALVMPLFMTWVMGNVLKGMLGEATVSPASVLIVNADAPVAAAPALPFGSVLAQALTDNAEIRRVLVARPVADLGAAREQVAAGKASAVLYIPATFTADALAGRDARVQLATDPGDPTRGAMVTQVVRTFADEFASHLQEARLAGGTPPPALEIAEVAAGTRPVSAMQYYAAACAVLFTLVTALMRGGLVLEERAAGTLQRMLTTPASRGEVLAGLLAGSALLNLVQWLVLLPVTRLVLGVSWGPWPAAILLGAAFALASAGIGTAAAAVLKDRRAADMASGTVGNLLGVLSGSLVPLYAFPEALKLVARFTPNYWAMQGFLDQMSGQGRLALPVAVLAAIALVTGAFGTWRLATK